MAAMADNTPPRTPPRWRVQLESFWRWWAGELMQAAPERLAMLRGGDRAPLLAVEGDEAVLLDARLASGSPRVSLAGLDEARRKAAVRGLLERAGEKRSRARACLAHGEVLMRRVTMPAATEENLRQVLGFEMDRLTPFTAAEVYFDYRVISRDAAAGQIGLQLAIARRDIVDARVQELRALGVSVQGVAVREDAGNSPPLDLLPSEQRGERESSRERTMQRAALIVVGLLLLAALLLPVIEKRQALIALSPMMTKARGEAQAADSVAKDLERQVGDYNFIVGRKYGTYPAAAVIEEVTRLLPDNTWVQQLEIKNNGKVREVQITGETASASKLIEIFEGSTMLQNAAFRGTVTRGSQPGTERFMIAAEVRPRTPPESRPVLEMVAMPPPARTAPPPAAAPPAGAPAAAAAPEATNPPGAPEPLAPGQPALNGIPNPAAASPYPPPAPAKPSSTTDANGWDGWARPNTPPRKPNGNPRK